MWRNPDSLAIPGGSRYGAADVHYPAVGGASAALVVTSDITFTTVVAEYVTNLATVEPYRPGGFFARELPALRAALAEAGASGGGSLDLLIVDGYVDLDPYGRPGLGAYAHARFQIPVIGVAKTSFRGATHAVAVHRGGAGRPLYVTAVGVPLDRAADLVRQMSGRYRLPDALRRVDALARGHVRPAR